MVGSSEAAAEVRAYRSPLGQRLVVRGRIGELLRYTQTLTLWHGVDRVDCRTTIDDFTGDDRLLRLRWPCPVPGAHAGQRGRRRRRRARFRVAARRMRTRSVDTADHPWTLDNPAYGWFGLSSAARVARRTTVCARCRWPRWWRRRSRGAAVLARDLMVALVRAGVTATCSERRQTALRRSRRRLQPARHPHRAGRAGSERVHRRGAGRRRPGLHRRTRAAARRHRPGQGVGARRRAVGGRLGARRRPARARGRCRCW